MKFSDEHFTPDSLVEAIRTLFENNNYDVRGPLKLHGAEVDLHVTPRHDPFAYPIYIEATIEYVDVDKYGKDSTKFLMIREKEPAARLLLISSRGFSLPVQERAAASRVDLRTYESLFRSFEKFEPYFNRVLQSDLERALEAIYEQPQFVDKHGTDNAIAYLLGWATQPKPDHRWMVITGEYGTGKTALTRVLTYRLLELRRSSPQLPLPIRIPLRLFHRQFDADSLLHHFLDHNGLGHIPLQFLLNLIRSGRVVLVLDGYDEMAQFMNARERRACLEALAALASEGARGVLTSRPNYFTEGEELNVAETLYRSLGAFTANPEAVQRLVAKERRLDELLTRHVIERFERKLQDLTEEQTYGLVSRVLAANEAARDAVLGTLNRVFRSEAGGRRSLSGKPVIITYLLEVSESIANSEQLRQGVQQDLSEWGVFELISEQLMLRDYERAPNVLPHVRLAFLCHFAVWCSVSAQDWADEAAFRDIVAGFFKKELARDPRRENKLDQLFADLRSSATLTRSGQGQEAGWAFSHNSLREFLVAKAIVTSLLEVQTDSIPAHVAVSDAMRGFVAAMPGKDRERVLRQLAQSWASRDLRIRSGPYMSLFLDALRSSSKSDGSCDLTFIAGRPLDLAWVRLSKASLAHWSEPSLSTANLAGCDWADVTCDGTDMPGVDFSGGVLDSCRFRGADLRNAKFDGALLYEVDVTNARLQGASFRGVGGDVSIRVEDRVLSGRDAVGFLRYVGAQTDPVPQYFVLQHCDGFDVPEKIAKKLVEGGIRQRRGLTQRGVARGNPNLARDFLAAVESMGWAVPLRTDQVEITPAGRTVLGDFVEHKRVNEELERVLRKLLK